MSQNRKYNLLIVDDESEIIENLMYDLKDLDAEIAVAKNGQEALCQLAINKFDCILTDIKMPVIDGISFADQLSAQKNQTPVIFHTAHGDESLVNQMSYLRPLDIIHKPYEKDGLVFLIEEAFCVSDERKRAS